MNELDDGWEDNPHGTVLDIESIKHATMDGYRVWWVKRDGNVVYLKATFYSVAMTRDPLDAYMQHMRDIQ